MSLSPEDLRLIGGSDVAAILGKDGNRSAVDVFQRCMTGEQPPVSPELQRLFDRGHMLEPVIRAMSVRDYGLALLGPRKLRDPRRSYVRASLDDVHMADHGEEVVEFKSVGEFAGFEYGAPGTDDVPLKHLCQVQFYLAQHGAPRARLYALIGVDDLREYRIEADMDVQGILLEAVDRFHRDHLETGVPPRPDGTDSYATWLTRRYPKREAKLILQADDALAELAEQHREARDAEKAWEKRKKTLAQQIASQLGEAAGAEGFLPDGRKWRLTNRLQANPPVVDWEALAFECGIPAGTKEKFTTRGTHIRLSNNVLKGGK